MSAMLPYIITNAVLFSFLMASAHIPQDMAAWIMNKGFGMISFLLMITYIPQISLWLPNLVFD